ncbi:MAG: PhoX family protein, partial [Acidimicrobiales bacterium]|nr:PhoX family protein [Acidimicrobiales bacterium]
KGGVLYRFTPDAYPDLSSGRLEAMIVAEPFVTWGEVADPTGASVPTQEQVPEAYVTPGAEGIWYHDGWIWFTTKTDNRVHAVDLRNQRHELVWDGSGDRQPLTGVDNITVEEGSGDLFVAEDGGNMELVVISPEGEVAPFCRIADLAHEGSEVTGPCFNPTRDRLYFSSQRGPTTRPTNEMVPAVDLGNFGGVTYEVTGPFRGRIEPTTTTTIPPPTTTLARAAEVSVASSESDEGGGGTGLAVGLSAAVLAVFGVGLLALRRRTGESDGPEGEPTEGDGTG